MTAIRAFPPLLLLVLPAAVMAQVSIGPDGIRSGGTRIDAGGVHAPGAEVTAAGVRSGTGGGTVILTNGGTRSVDCHGGRLTVDGNANRLDVVRCATVTVAGNDNVVTARFDAPGRIGVPGNRNRITWRAGPRIQVQVSTLGNRNAVARR